MTGTSCLTGLACVAMVLLSSSCVKQSVGEREREVLLQISDLADFGIKIPNAARYEKFEKSRYFDGSCELNYDFSLPDSVEVESVSYLNVTATVERTLADAAMSHGVEGFATRTGFKWAKLTLEEKKDYFRYGDQSTFYLLRRENRPVGNFFVMRKGLHIYSVVLVGLYFSDNDKQDWADLVTPKLEKFLNYKP